MTSLLIALLPVVVWFLLLHAFFSSRSIRLRFWLWQHQLLFFLALFACGVLMFGQAPLGMWAINELSAARPAPFRAFATPERIIPWCAAILGLNLAYALYLRLRYQFAAPPVPACGRCRYQLTGLTPAAGMVRCPECGTRESARAVLARYEFALNSYYLIRMLVGLPGKPRPPGADAQLAPRPRRRRPSPEAQQRAKWHALFTRFVNFVVGALGGFWIALSSGGSGGFVLFSALFFGTLAALFGPTLLVALRRRI